MNFTEKTTRQALLSLKDPRFNKIIGNGSGKLQRGSGRRDLFVGSDAGGDYFIGNDGDDVIYGFLGNDILQGGNGHDLIFGGGGNDSLWGNNGNDTLYGGNGNDSINAGDDDDLVSGGFGNDRIWGMAGNDTLYGNRGADSIDGGDGNDVIYASINPSTFAESGVTCYLSGGAGNDYFFYGNLDGTVYGGSGIDTIDFSLVPFVVDGGFPFGISIDLDGEGFSVPVRLDVYTACTVVDVENVVGSNGNDILGDSAQDNIIDGGAGDDWILSTRGADTLIGGAGNDTYYIFTAEMTQLVTVEYTSGWDQLILQDVDSEKVNVSRKGASNDLSVSIFSANKTNTVLIKNGYAAYQAGKFGIATSDGRRITQIGESAVRLSPKDISTRILTGGSRDDFLSTRTNIDLNFDSLELTGNSGNDIFEITPKSDFYRFSLIRISDFETAKGNSDTLRLDSRYFGNYTQFMNGLTAINGDLVYETAQFKFTLEQVSTNQLSTKNVTFF